MRSIAFISNSLKGFLSDSESIRDIHMRFGIGHEKPERIRLHALHQNPRR